MKIKFDIKILFLIIFYFYTKQLKIYVIVMLFLVFHELSHCFVSLCYKRKIETIKIHILGLEASIDNMEELSFEKKIIIYLSGPLLNIIIGMLFSIINYNKFKFLIWINLFLGMFNLLPIIPLDGGRIFFEFLKEKNGINKAFIYIHRFCDFQFILLGIAVIILFVFIKNSYFVLIYLYLYYINKKEEENIKIYLEVCDSFKKIIAKKIY